jgi:hypothetical protein
MLNQAREFNSSVKLTGLILTKLDGSARGGAVVGEWGSVLLPCWLEPSSAFCAGLHARELSDVLPDLDLHLQPLYIRLSCRRCQSWTN